MFKKTGRSKPAIYGWEDWTEIINSKLPLFNLKLNETWRYRDLIYMLVRRDIVTQYKQTILGPLWYIIQPLLTTVIFTVIFGNIAKIPTDSIPPTLFYLAGLTCWNYFSGVLQLNSSVFIDSQAIFGKIYFPRITVPVSIVFSNLIKFGIQFALFIAFWMYFYFKGAPIKISIVLLLVPILIVVISGLSLGFGMLFSAFTTKYKDLKFFLQFGIQLWMYATPIIYPLSNLSPKHQWILVLNPVTSIIEAFKYAFVGKGTLNLWYLMYSALFMVVLLFIAVIIFNRIEKNFMDTV